MQDISRLEEIIGYSFKDKQLLITALTHSSYVNENRNSGNVPEDNERLEFFGDAIIEFFVSEYLYNKYSDIPEGDLTRLRASMVCESSLSKCSRMIDLGNCLRMGKGEESQGGRKRDSVISDAFEALTAAIFLDSGAEDAKLFITEHLLKTLGEQELFFDAKTRLQELIQKRTGQVLKYELISDEGPSHDKVFVEAALLDGVEIGRGSGHSKKAAQQNAAASALKNLAESES